MLSWDEWYLESIAAECPVVACTVTYTHTGKNSKEKKKRKRTERQISFSLSHSPPLSDLSDHFCCSSRVKEEVCSRWLISPRISSIEPSLLLVPATSLESPIFYHRASFSLSSSSHRRYWMNKPHIWNAQKHPVTIEKRATKPMQHGMTVWLSRSTTKPFVMLHRTLENCRWRWEIDRLLFAIWNRII